MRAVVVGAGPAGAALAYLLARRGAGVTLLERQTDFAREFRGEGLMPGGVDALVQMGLGAQLDALPQSRVRRFEIFQDARLLIALQLGPGSRLGDGPRFVSQPALLEMLVAEASALPGFRIERGFTVRDLVRRNGRTAGVRGDAASGPSEVLGDFVIGTDGRASAVRKHSDLDRAREPQSFDVLWCKLPLPEFGEQGVGRVYLGRGHFCIVFPAPDGRLQIGWVIDKGTFGDLRRRGVDGWLGQLAEHVSADFAAHIAARGSEITHPFLLDVVCDHLEEWCSPGLLLLGDASHPMSPVGAQGINIALRDAIVAANHLGPVLAAGAAPGEVDAAARRVRDERLPEVRTIQRLQKIPPRILFQRTRASRTAARVLAPLLVRSGIAPLLFGFAFRRFARGTTSVRLDSEA